MSLKLSLVAIVLLSLSFVALSAETKDADAKDKDAVQGTWIPATAELAGEKFPDDVRKSIKLVIKDDQYTVTVGSQGDDKGTIKLDPPATPKTLDITGTDGPNKGKTFLCIYELKHDEANGDTWRICYDLSGKARPTEFKTAPNTKLYLVTYTREK